MAHTIIEINGDRIAVSAMKETRKERAERVAFETRLDAWIAPEA